MRAISEKRAMKLKEPGMVVRGTFAKKAADILAGRDEMSRKVREIMFGGGKPSAKEKGERSAAKAKAWTQFSRFIRLRDADENGMVKCATCPAVLHWSKADAGHAVAGRGGAILFNEQATAAQCRECNRVHDGRPKEFAVYVDERHGPGTHADLVRKSKKAVRHTTEDYRFIETTCLLRIANMRIKSPNKFK